ncbi:MAG: hypothetical protein IKN81_07495 [Oscillospiraceae bacterium]|nr:hypothetical protein [Oscillospiraceae bacterium]
MEAVFGVLSTVLSAIAAFFHMLGNVHALVIELFGSFGVTFFLFGFFGLLMTFLWFLFRFIDKKRLAMPTVFFTIFFLIFLGGNLLMLSQASQEEKAPAAEQTVEYADDQAAV